MLRVLPVDVSQLPDRHKNATELIKDEGSAKSYTFSVARPCHNYVYLRKYPKFKNVLYSKMSDILITLSR
ncbi:LOW QUALITY PROTEIN: hypothetical protein HZS_3895 [Henneguya salminicola]|nr:LOW QUALITY PROTEIN: hypothetical protein HZS_3895 [Henneguya salminicola]